MRLTEEEFKELQARLPRAKDLSFAFKKEEKKPSKYHNRKVEYYDPGLKETITFDSEKERDYYLLLKDREQRGEIQKLERQVSITIQPAFTDKNGKKIREITYIADFIYYEYKDGKIHQHIIDVKGSTNTLTEVYKLKKKLLAYKGIYIEEVY